MEGEIQRYIKVWVTVTASLCYCYTISKLTPKGPIQLLTILPIIFLFLYLPLNLTTVHLTANIAFFVTCLASFKLLLFCFSKGPLYSDPPISLPRFVALACLPVKIQPTQKHKLSKKSPWNYSVKVLVLALLIRIYDYTNYIHPKLLWALYGFHMYLYLEILLAIAGALARAILGVELEPQFDEPYLSTSLQDFWGRRWNIMVSSILRPTVYHPSIWICTRWIPRKWASLPAIFMTFLVSGLMHELMIFYLGRMKPTWEMTGFFVIQGLCLVVEVGIKKVVKGRWGFPWYISWPLCLGFVMVTAFWLFFPQFLRCDVDGMALAEYAALGAFVKDAGISIIAFTNSFNAMKS